MKIRAAVILLLLALPAGFAVASSRADQGFPHERHAGLFPLCTGCHGGIPEGREGGFYPPSELCARCHDGENVERVAWTGPDRESTNLDFSHPEHAEALGRLECTECHSEPGAARMTIVRRAEPATCLSCHAHEADSHFVDADCSTCHVPLAASGFGSEEIAGLPEPDDHDRADFIAEVHGEAAEEDVERCATCHVQNRCVSCHVTTRAEIEAIPAAPPAMPLPAYRAEYPVPASHTSPDWLDDHGQRASLQSCGTCHTRQDCRACHGSPLPGAAAALPGRDETAAPGAGITPRMPASHASAFFVTEHAGEAAAEPELCTTCHTESFCSDCHDAPVTAERLGASAGSVQLHEARRGPDEVRGPEFHPPNFVQRHSADAFGQTMECASCHSVEAFCRACHLEEGFGAIGRLNRGFHDAQPLWLLRHGQAARQELESCASCHTQQNCMQCHSTLGAFKVSPHGPGFDARLGWEKNPRTCLACHLGNPLGGEER